MAKKSKTFGSGEPKKMAVGGTTTPGSGPQSRGGGFLSRYPNAKGPFGVLAAMAAARMGSEKAAALAKSNPRFAAFLGNNPSAAATPAPTQPSARRTYTPMPAGYNPAAQGEWNFFQPKPAATPMKKGGKVAKVANGGKVVRGDGACIKGKTKGTMR